MDGKQWTKNGRMMKDEITRNVVAVKNGRQIRNTGDWLTDLGEDSGVAFVSERLLPIVLALRPNTLLRESTYSTAATQTSRRTDRDRRQNRTEDRKKTTENREKKTNNDTPFACQP